MDLLPGERVLLESDNNKLVLTTHRVRFTTSSWGLTQKITSIMLEELSSSEIIQGGRPILLWAAAVAAFVTAIAYPRDTSLGLFFTGFLVVLYFLSRRKMIVLRSAGAAIYVRFDQMNIEMAQKFLDAVESAKNTRNLALGRSASV